MPSGHSATLRTTMPTAGRPTKPGAPNLPPQDVAPIFRSGGLTANVGLLGLVGIEFLQELNGDFYLLASGNGMKIAEVF